MYITLGISWSTFFAVVATATLAIGAIVFGVNLSAANTDRQALQGSVRVIAEVIEVDVVKSGSNRDRETLVTPTVMFTTDEGVDVTSRLPAGRGELSYSVGDLVAVYYDRAEPSQVRPEGDVADPYIAMFGSTLAIIGAVALFVVARVIRRKR